MTLLLAVLQATALMVLQHAMLGTEMTRAESAVPDNALGGVFAVFEGAADFLGGHAAADGERECEEGVGGKIETGECGRR